MSPFDTALLSSAPAPTGRRIHRTPPHLDTKCRSISTGSASTQMHRHRSPGAHGSLMGVSAWLAVQKRTTLVDRADRRRRARVVVHNLGKPGWRVLVHARDRRGGEALLREIEQAGGQLRMFLRPISRRSAEVGQLAEAVERRTDRPSRLLIKMRIAPRQRPWPPDQQGLRELGFP